MTETDQRPSRNVAIDVIRGAIMLLMAVDHVRVYSGLPAGGPTPGIFFTRWITHFCAPGFVFLAGTSAFFHGRKLGDRGALSRFLLVRGMWLILLELTIVRLGWTFNLDFAHYLLAGVIWVIGWSMIVLAALVHLPVSWIAALSGLVVVGHNLLDQKAAAIAAQAETIPPSRLWQLVYGGGGFQIGEHGPLLIVLYVLVPWVAVMALGYAFGAVLQWEPDRRRRACLFLGIGAILAFVALRGFNLYGDPRPWSGERMPAALSFLNATKYPASLLFLLMTLGPTIALIPALEGSAGRVSDVLRVFGRVPLFYYLLHIPLIHALAIGVSVLRTGHMDPWLFANHPVLVPPAPDGYTWGLGLLYLVTAVAIALLYVPCGWYGRKKAGSKAAIFSYL